MSIDNGYVGAYETVPALVIDNLRAHDEVDLAPKRVVLVEKEIWSEVETRNKRQIFSGTTGVYTVQGTTVSGITLLQSMKCVIHKMLIYFFVFPIICNIFAPRSLIN